MYILHLSLIHIYKALDLNIGAEKSAYTPGENVVLNAKVTDLDANGVRKANIDLVLLDDNGKSIDRKTVQSGNTGEFTVNFTAPAKLGKYTVEAKASYNDFKNANGLAIFSVDANAKEFTSYEERKASGQYKHLKTTDFEYEALQKHYGKNILQYYVCLLYTSIKLKVNETSTIKASVEPSNATNRAIYWTSTNTRVATVQGGFVKAIAKGECDIIAKTANGVYKKAHVIVYDENNDNDDNDKNIIKVSSSVYALSLIHILYGLPSTVASPYNLKIPDLLSELVKLVISITCLS